MFVVDRLSDLRNITYDQENIENSLSSKAKSTSQDKITSTNTLVLTTTRCNEIKKNIDVIKGNMKTIAELKRKHTALIDNLAQKNLLLKINDIINSTFKLAKLIKDDLDSIKVENEVFVKLNPASATIIELKNNIYQKYLRQFHSTINEYNKLVANFKEYLVDGYKRRIKLIDPSLSEEQISKIVESENVEYIVQQGFIENNLQQEQRHLDIVTLEQQVLQIAELFRDLSFLIDSQQESLDVIEYRIIKAKNHTEKGEVELNHAQNYQGKTRSRQCCLLFIVVAILVVILAPILSTKAL